MRIYILHNIEILYRYLIANTYDLIIILIIKPVYNSNYLAINAFIIGCM